MPAPKIIKIGQNTALILASIVLSLVIAEIALRLTGIGKYSLYDRILFFTKPSLVRTEDKTVRYEPRTKIRSVAIYGDEVDYDIVYGTNNLGFVDDVDYNFDSAPGKKVVFVGDSFTAGDGGNKSWISQLRRRLDRPEISLYNLGITGAGVKQFQQLLTSVKDEAHFDEINIMVIGNDFFGLCGIR
ncbi:SGNH/GDSL hydrolase family protein [Synechocystis sp. B12]|nr:SGNH/GDSL hydrolase family protein [Synechocystis sp. B12]